RRLRDAASTGVLGVAELEWRLGRVLSAVTRGQLEAVLLDLPPPRNAPRAPGRGWLRWARAGVAILNRGLVAVLVAAGLGYFWPVWPLIGWGMVLSGHAWSASLLADGREP